MDNALYILGHLTSIYTHIASEGNVQARALCGRAAPNPIGWVSFGRDRTRIIQQGKLPCAQCEKIYFTRLGLVVR